MEKCSICLNDIIDNKELLKCCHIYHKECIDEWLKTKNTCPLCRMKVKDDIDKQIPQRYGGGQGATFELVRYDAADVYLTGGPSVTFFRTDPIIQTRTLQPDGQYVTRYTSTPIIQRRTSQISETRTNHRQIDFINRKRNMNQNFKNMNRNKRNHR